MRGGFGKSGSGYNNGGWERRENRPNKICFEFQRSGQCHRGDTCAFLHAAGGQGGQGYHNRGPRPQYNGPHNGPHGNYSHGPRPHNHYGQQSHYHHPPHEKKPATWLPPGSAGRRQTMFGMGLDPGFIVPPRLRNKNAELVDAVNDWHYAMVNDLQRNEFYRECLRQVITPESCVLEIGTGTGLLAMLAAKLGAKWVVAVEANIHMAELARSIIAANGFADRITVLHKLSTELTPADLPSRPNVLVSEVFGTLLLGESVLPYVHDCRVRLMEPSAHIIPPLGVQFATPIECEAIRSITSVTTWDSFDLHSLNSLQDTATTVFTKQYGFRLASVPHKRIADAIPLLELDFRTANPDPPKSLQRFRFVAKETGTIHAIMLWWKVSSADGSITMSTAPEDSSFQRDLQWGQAVQLVEDIEAGKTSDVPIPFQVTAGEELVLVARFSADGVQTQFQLERSK